MSDMGWAHYEQEQQRIDDEDAAYAQHELEQALLRADPAFDDWLDQLELKHEEECNGP